MNQYIDERYRFEDMFNVRLVPQFKNEIGDRIYQSYSCVANDTGGVIVYGRMEAQIWQGKPITVCGRRYKYE